MMYLLTEFVLPPGDGSIVHYSKIEYNTVQKYTILQYQTKQYSRE